MVVRSAIAFLMMIFFVVGCGKPPMQTVSGSVKLDGKAVSNCKVGFFPDLPDTVVFNPDHHGFGAAITDKEGHFEIAHPQGNKGIWAGKYKVTFEAWVTKKGASVPADSKPSEVEGGVKNLFPDLFAEPSRTTEKAVVKEGANVFDFNIVSK